RPRSYAPAAAPAARVRDRRRAGCLATPGASHRLAVLRERHQPGRDLDDGVPGASHPARLAAVGRWPGRRPPLRALDRAGPVPAAALPNWSATLAALAACGVAGGGRLGAGRARERAFARDYVDDSGGLAGGQSTRSRPSR